MIDWRSLLTRWRWEVALAGCIVVSLGVLAMSETGHQRLIAQYDQALRSMWAAGQLGEMRALLVDAESGQRGFLLTGVYGYLDPYHAAIRRIGELQAQLQEYYLQRGDQKALDAFATVNKTVGTKLSELEQSLRLAEAGKVDLARELVMTNVGRDAMRELRERLREMQVLEREVTAEMVYQWRSNLRLSRLGIATITALNVALLVLIVRWLKRDWERARERERELDRKVNDRTRQLASLSAYLQEVSEAEKTRLGRELHDELGAILTATRLDLVWVRGRLSTEQSALREKLQRALDNLDQGITIKRRIIEDLRPSVLSSFGLTTAVREMAEQAAERMGWELELDLPDSDPDLDEEIEIAMFRILQEALNNAAKYARATRIRISLLCDTSDAHRCKLEIEDDGVGFRLRDVRADAHGLMGMRQRLEPRGGSFVVRSVPGRGTTVQAIMPLRPRSPKPCDVGVGAA